MVGDDDEARDRVGDRRREVPLALQLELAALAVGDVDAPGHDPDDVPVLVDEGRRLPGDHPFVAERVREDVLVLGRGERRRRVVEALDHRLPLDGVDEDLPEVPALDPGPIAQAARDLDGAVEVPYPALGVDDREEARGGVDDRLQEAVLRAQLRLQPLLLEGEGRGRRHGVDEPPLVGEAPVVEERRHRPASLLDEGRRVCAAGDGVLQRAPLVVDPGLALRRPVRELERRVTERVGERVAQRAPVAEGDHQVGDPGPLEPRAKDAGEEGDRHQGQGAERRELDREAGARVERPHEVGRHEADERDQGEEVDGADHAAQRGRGGAEPSDEPDEDGGRDRRGKEPERDADGLGQPGAVGHEERALRTVVAPRDGGRVDERDGERAERHEREDDPHEPFVPRMEPPGRVREDQVGEGHEGDTREDVPEREPEGPLGELEGAHRPEEPDREHLGTGSVVGPLERGDRAHDGEDEARDGDHRDQRAGLPELGGRNEVDRAAVEHRAQADGGGQAASGHRRSRRTAAPVSSAFAMKPRAPLAPIRPL